ncbi:MAG TPA: bifunctional diaminohydroxyphosphoribosylaminopyrimidine deaminase/5-amino-6-(5-phosphoribosylamino)uracil reductase RibD [Vicinamibacterales bacterium]|nr:bifunctional diaminohydroxyphosphoribosylaminopyrimidine deaminase/5-amino-6-(5-phosphoribosylamino)uracil reductase RibD [Vicinamibacterales bacterium]
MVASGADRAFMQRALFHAARGRGRTSPNPLVGAVVVADDGVVVGQGFHERAGGPHAEIHALSAAGARARGATLYSTLEPCCHQGRTGPCVRRIVEAGIRRVVAAVEDPNPAVRGRGFAFLREHGVTVDVGVAAEAAVALNRPFFTLMREGRPFVILKAATSIDGRIAAALRRRTALTADEANRHAHRVRAEVDAIVIGSETLLTDDPALTARGAFRERPLVRVVLDRRLRTPPSARLLSTLDAGPVIIVTSARGAAHADARGRLEACGARVEIASDQTFRAALDRIADHGVGSLLLEGGAAVHAAAWDEGLVDFVRLYITPHALGSDGVPLLDGRAFSSADLDERRVIPLGPDVVVEGYVHRTG